MDVTEHERLSNFKLHLQTHIKVKEQCIFSYQIVACFHCRCQTAVNGDIFIKNLQGGTFAFEHLYLQISDSNIPYEFFLGSYCLRNRNQANKWIKKQVFLLFRCQTTNSPIRAQNIYESSPFSRKKFLSLCNIVKTTEWNGLIKIDN